MHLEQSLKKYRLYYGIVYGYRYYIVCCPKYRYPVLHTLGDPRLQELILAKQESYGYRVLDMQAMPDHVHLLLDINPQSGMSAVKPGKSWHRFLTTLPVSNRHGSGNLPTSGVRPMIRSIWKTCTCAACKPCGDGK
jgi:putative transposase